MQRMKCMIVFLLVAGLAVSASNVKEGKKTIY